MGPRSGHMTTVHTAFTSPVGRPQPQRLNPRAEPALWRFGISLYLCGQHAIK